jgi:hypothetical protein
MSKIIYPTFRCNYSDEDIQNFKTIKVETSRYSFLYVDNTKKNNSERQLQ